MQTKVVNEASKIMALVELMQIEHLKEDERLKTQVETFCCQGHVSE